MPLPDTCWTGRHERFRRRRCRQSPGLERRRSAAVLRLSIQAAREFHMARANASTLSGAWPTACSGAAPAPSRLTWPSFGAGGNENEQLINSFTVNETYFYREDGQLRCLSRSLLPEIVQKRMPGRSRPYLVCPMLDRGGTLLRRHLAAGKLGPCGCLQYRDRRLGYRHASARAPRLPAITASGLSRGCQPT